MIKIWNIKILSYRGKNINNANNLTESYEQSYEQDK